MEKKLRQLEPVVTEEDLVIARKIQSECAARMRAVLAHSGPKRSLEERLDVQRRLRERAKRLADAVRNGRESVARTESAGLIPETRCRQVEVEVEAERQLLEGRLRDWTRQLEAGQIRYDQCEDQVERLKQELAQEQERHSALMAALENELQEQTTAAKSQLADLMDFEKQAVPLVEAYHKLKNEMAQAEQQSQEWRERLLNVAGQYAEEIQKLTQTRPSAAPASRPAPDARSRSPARGADLGERDASPARVAPQYMPPQEARADEARREPRPAGSPMRAEQKVADLSLIHAEALRTTELLEREIDALRDAVQR